MITHSTGSRWNPRRLLVVLATLSVLLIGSTGCQDGATTGLAITTTTPSPSYTDPAPSYTDTPPPSPRPASPPTVYNGRGDDIVSITKDPGVAVLQFECPKCSDNTIVTTDGSEHTLVNEIGSYMGKQLIDLRDGSTTTTVTVKATGAWKMTVASGLGAATVATGDAPVAGQGDDVVLMKRNCDEGTRHQPWAVQLHRLCDPGPANLAQLGSQRDRWL